MTPIPQKYCKNGYDYVLTQRKGVAAIYAQYWGKAVQAYEVVKIRVRGASVLNGVEMPESERLPSDNDWGALGWTYSASLHGQLGAFTKAEAKFGQLSAG